MNILRLIAALSSIVLCIRPALGSPPDQGCDRFFAGKDIGQVTITNNAGVDSWVGDDPREEVLLVYPTDALVSPFPFGPRKRKRQSAESFKLKADDGSVFSHSMLYDASGRRIKQGDLPNTIRILVQDSLQVQRIAATATRRALDIENGFDLPPLDLSATEYAGLFEIGSLKKWPTQQERWLIARNGDEVTDFIICNKPGTQPLPHCSHQFDFRSINIRMHYRATVVTEWRELRHRAETFLGCIYGE